MLQFLPALLSGGMKALLPTLGNILMSTAMSSVGTKLFGSDYDKEWIKKWRYLNLKYFYKYNEARTILQRNILFLDGFFKCSITSAFVNLPSSREDLI